MVPRFSVIEILDRTTILLAGALQELHEGTEVSVLGVGPMSSRLGAPIVVEKARLVVTLVSPAYAVARPPARTVTKKINAYTALFGSEETVTTNARDSLNVDDKSMVGNPAAQPIRVGDPVVMPQDLPTFIGELAAEMKAEKQRAGT